MKIAHFCESIESGGGIASFISNLTREQSQTEDVTVCSISYSTNNIQLSERVKSFCLNKQRMGFSIKYPIKIFQIIRKEKFDL